MRKPFLRGSTALLIAATGLLPGCEQSAQSIGMDPGAAGATVVAGAGTSVSSGGSGVGSNAGAATGGTVGSAGASLSGALGDEVTIVKECMITTPTHWEARVYLANCKVEVASSLTIEPGAMIKFGPGFYLDVLPGGTLSAIGSDSQPIVFTSLKDDAHGGDTNGDGASVGTANDWGCQGACGDLNIKGNGCVLDHVHALYGSNGVYVQAQSTQIKKSVFAHHGTYGLVVDGQFPVEMTQLTDNAFFDNHGYPLRLGKPVFLDASNVFHDPTNPDLKNAKQCIELGTDLDELVVLGVTELGFLFSGHRISGEVLTPPGVIFKAQAAAIYLDPGGSLFNGPNAIFTSYRDDSLGGDCTGDGPSTAAAGDWEGLWIDDGTSADFAAPVDYIRYAAKSGMALLH